MSSLKLPLADIQTTRDQKLGNGRWLSLHEVAFQDPSGTERRWEVCRRVKPASATAASKASGSAVSVDAVDVIAIIKNASGLATNIIVVVQYRPALGAFAIEFPSGLIDPQEEPAQAALRELQEETGFGPQSGHVLKVVHTSVPVAYEPGLTASCSQVVVVEIEAEQSHLFGPTAITRQSNLEDDEWSLQVLILPLSNLLETLQAVQASAGGPTKLVLDSRLYAWAVGRQLRF